ncbi:MAG: hypothetical protein NVSMB26_04490 [Beijerinckiaceae bacterium]
MTTTPWIELLVLGGPIVWLSLKFGMRFTGSPEAAGCVLLKQKASALGVDVNRIPESAWDSIVNFSIASAKDRAMSVRTGLAQGDESWRTNLARTLEEEAIAISICMNGKAYRGRSVAPQILAEYRV